jgi:hypothetical protein
MNVTIQTIRNAWPRVTAWLLEMSRWYAVTGSLFYISFNENSADPKVRMWVTATHEPFFLVLVMGCLLVEWYRLFKDGRAETPVEEKPAKYSRTTMLLLGALSFLVLASFLAGPWQVRLGIILIGGGLFVFLTRRKRVQQ